jgi:ribonuclease P/MRP protein subunit POP3
MGGEHLLAETIGLRRVAVMALDVSLSSHGHYWILHYVGAA